MRTILMKSAGVLGALAIGMSVSACAPSGAQDELAMNTSGKADGAIVEARNDSAAAEAEARAAQARADAAEAKLQCERDRQAASNRGAIVGGVTGAVVGSQVAGSGAKSEGGAIGAVAGVLAGRQIAKKDHRC